MLVRLRSSAVVGIGSSGLQTIGTIAPFAKSVSVFARSKFWVSTDWNYKCRLRKCRLTWEDMPSGFPDQSTLLGRTRWRTRLEGRELLLYALYSAFSFARRCHSHVDRQTLTPKGKNLPPTRKSCGSMAPTYRKQPCIFSISFARTQLNKR